MNIAIKTQIIDIIADISAKYENIYQAFVKHFIYTTCDSENTAIENTINIDGDSANTDRKIYVLSFDCAHKTLAYTYIYIDVDKIRKTCDNITSLKKCFDEYIICCNENVLKEDVEITYGILINLIEEIKSSVLFYNFVSYGVVDVVEGKTMKSTTAKSRALYLRKYLDKFTADMGAQNHKIDANTYILIESQPAFNNKSTSVEDQLLMYFAYSNVISVPAGLKNKIFYTEFFKYQNMLAERLEGTKYCRVSKNANNGEETVPSSNNVEETVPSPNNIQNNVQLSNTIQNTIQSTQSTKKKATSRDREYINKIHTRENFLYFCKKFNIEYVLKNVPKSHYDDIADSFQQIIAWLWLVKFI